MEWGANDVPHLRRPEILGADVYPALTDWANLWRTSGAFEDEARHGRRPLQGLGALGPWLKPFLLVVVFSAAPRRGIRDANNAPERRRSPD